MFSEQDVMVVQERMKDKAHQRDEDRLLAPLRRQKGGGSVPSHRRGMTMTVRVLMRKLRPV